MPATLVAEHLALAAPGLSIDSLTKNLCGMERAVALYASDMPSRFRFRRDLEPALLAWIGQGVDRLGREEVRRQASFFAGHRKLWLRDLLTPEIDRRHRARFPLARRLDMAERMASVTIMLTGVAPDARDLPEVIDGPCPKCDGAGKLWGNWVIDDASGWYEEGFALCWLCRDAGDE
ncbi:hypothetical protein [Streptomyces sp. NPDC008150]|uniref:hypothetical protein n=1 Tax=Streptomyces sp. NPDC008150 TaxID=3364816 RepID=UPI0036EF0BA9